MNQLMSSSQRASPGHLRADPMIAMTFSASPFFASFLAVITIAYCILSIFVSLSIFSIRMCPPLGQGPRSLADHRIHRVQQRPAHRFCPFPWCWGFPWVGGKLMMNRLFLLFLQEKLTGLCILSLEFLTEKSVRVLKLFSSSGLPWWFPLCFQCRGPRFHLWSEN